MTRGSVNEYESNILSVVARKGAIQAVNLALDVMSIINPQRFDTEPYHEAIRNLAASGQILEFGYIETTDPKRIKLIYFQKGTVLMGDMLGATDGKRTEDSVDRDSQADS